MGEQLGNNGGAIVEKRKAKSIKLKAKSEKHKAKNNE